MRNPDPWQPQEPQPDPPPITRRAALIGLAVILILMLAGLFLTRTLGGSARPAGLRPVGPIELRRQSLKARGWLKL